MRIGQLSRKYNVTIPQIISYLKEVDAYDDAIGHNSKLDDAVINLIAERFGSDPEEDVLIDSENDEQTDDNAAGPEADESDQGIEEAEPDLTSIPELNEEAVEDIIEQEIEEEVVIESDQLLEMLESEETPIDISKVTRIKAPKKELGGLKVVGKIELKEPELKKVDSNDTESTDAEENSRKKPQVDQPGRLSAEEVEQRRLRAKKKKERRQAMEEKRRKDREERQRKAQREAHYKEKIKNKKVRKSKTNRKSPKTVTETVVQEQKPEPKTLIGKFVRWLWHAS